MREDDGKNEISGQTAHRSLEKSMCTSLDGWYLLYAVSSESGRHPKWYDTLVVYLLFMKAKDTASKKAAMRSKFRLTNHQELFVKTK